MLQIKTIFYKIDLYEKFDREVNEALADGWELVRRDVLVPHVQDRYTLLYAEFERDIAEEEEEDGEADTMAEWVFSRHNPLEPYHCSNCGGAADPDKPLPNLCPNCQKIMRRAGK